MANNAEETPPPETPELSVALNQSTFDTTLNDFEYTEQGDADGGNSDEEGEEFKDNFREADTDKDHRLSLEGRYG